MFLEARPSAGTVVACEAMFCARDGSASPVVACEAMFNAAQGLIPAPTAESGTFGGSSARGFARIGLKDPQRPRNIACQAPTVLTDARASRNNVCQAKRRRRAVRRHRCVGLRRNDHASSEEVRGAAALSLVLVGGARRGVRAPVPSSSLQTPPTVWNGGYSGRRRALSSVPAH